MNIRINVRNVYGTPKAYPVCENAQIFAAIKGDKTLGIVTLAQVLRLGYEIHMVLNGFTVGVVKPGPGSIPALTNLLNGVAA